MGEDLETKKRGGKPYVLATICEGGVSNLTAIECLGVRNRISGLHGKGGKQEIPVSWDTWEKGPCPAVQGLGGRVSMAVS